MTYTPDPDFLTVMSNRPWRVREAGRAMARAHVAIHACEAPRALPSINEEMRSCIAVASVIGAPLVAYVLAVLRGLPCGSRLCHGDFHFGNLLGAMESPTIIDWADASRGDPHADVARTRILLRFGEPPPGTRLFVRRLTPLGRWMIDRCYLGGYQRAVTIDRDILARWEVVQAAARLEANIPSERLRLTGFLEAARAGRCWRMRPMFN